MADAKPPKPATARNQTTTFAVVGLLLSLVGAGAGFTVAAILAPAAAPPRVAVAPPPAAEAKPPGGDAKPAAEAAAGEDLPPITEVQVPMVILPLPPLLTNIAEPKDTWIRLEGSLLLKKDSDDPAPILVEHAGEQILTLLRTTRLADIAGPSGFLQFREDLNDTVSAASKGQVREVLIHTMVME